MSVVLVLNADYSPLNVTSLHRGFVLVYKGKAEIVKKSENDIITTIGNYVRPLIIRLLNYIRYKPKIFRPTRGRIMKRDNFTCQYCGTKKRLTIDHVIPKSKGGKNEWSNMVTCCFGCNNLKGNKTPEEAGVKLINKPYEPSIFSSVFYRQAGEIWEEYQNMFV